MKRLFAAICGFVTFALPMTSEAIKLLGLLVPTQTEQREICCCSFCTGRRDDSNPVFSPQWELGWNPRVKVSVSFSDWTRLSRKEITNLFSHVFPIDSFLKSDSRVLPGTARNMASQPLWMHAVYPYSIVSWPTHVAWSLEKNNFEFDLRPGDDPVLYDFHGIRRVPVFRDTDDLALHLASWKADSPGGILHASGIDGWAWDILNTFGGGADGFGLYAGAFACAEANWNSVVFSGGRSTIDLWLFALMFWKGRIEDLFVCKRTISLEREGVPSAFDRARAFGFPEPICNRLFMRAVGMGEEERVFRNRMFEAVFHSHTSEDNPRSSGASWTVTWTNETFCVTSSSGERIVPFGRFRHFNAVSGDIPFFKEGFVWAEYLHPDLHDGSDCLVDAAEDCPLGNFLDESGRSLLSFPAHALESRMPMAGAWWWCPRFDHGLAFVRLCDGNVYGISTNGTILDVHEKVGPFVYFRGFDYENPYLFYHGDCALVILLDGKFAVLNAKHDLAFPPSDDASFVEKRWKEELEALGKNPFHRFPTNGLIDRVDRIFDEVLFPSVANPDILVK